MIEKLFESEMIHPIEVGRKINEIIDVINNHTHKQYEYGLVDYEDGPSTSTLRVDIPALGNILSEAMLGVPDSKPFDWAEQAERIEEEDGA